MSNDWHYARSQLAKQYTARLQDPLFSRIALIGSRRIGKTAFILNDLAPALIKEGCLPIYISLWSDRSAPHMEFIAKFEAVIVALKDKTPISALMRSEVTKLSLGNSLLGKIDMDFTNAKAANSNLLLIRSLLSEIIRLAKKKRVILLLDEIQHLLTDKAFHDFQYALRTLFDEIGDSISVLYTGSSRTGMGAMFANKDLPFYHSAQPTEFPVIDDGFVDFCVERVKSYGLACDHVQMLGFWRSTNNSPYWTIILIRHMVMQQCSVSTAIEHINHLVADDGDFVRLSRRLSLIEKLVLVRVSHGQPLYSVQAFEDYKKADCVATRSKVQTALTKLVTKRIITKLPDLSYLIEVEGFVATIEKELQSSRLSD
jgi:hypothetical protein